MDKDENQLEKSQLIAKVVLFSVLGIMVIVTMFLALKELEARTPIYSTVIEKINITALTDSDSISGHFSGGFFAQSGRIDQDLYYRVMLFDGSKKRFYKLFADTTDIYEFEPGEDVPHIEVTWRIKEVKGKAVKVFLADTSLDGFSNNIGIIQNISLYIPKNTIDSSFELDLKD